MKVEALRGVCIGPDRHLVPGDVVDVDHATAQFLVSIGAVKPAPVATDHEPVKPAKKTPAPKE